MQDWMLPRITDYWDQQVEAIERLSRALEGLSDVELNTQVETIAAAVKRHAAVLSDEHLRLAALVLVEDLYKSAAQTSRIDQPLLSYLHASGGALLDAVAARGYMLHYFIDNTWERLDGPVIGFPMLFGAAGLFYLCPQALAARQFEKDEPREQWPALVSKYIVDARLVADDLAERCHQDRRHFVYLDIDATEFPAAFKHVGEPGVIHVFRSEAPTPGSRCAVKMPPGPRLPNPSTSPQGS
jgi:hypothetical protein